MGIVKYNIQKLRELCRLIDSIPDELYNRKEELMSNSSIGQHFRHIVEFYQAILNYKEKTICYDDRLRNGRLETDRTFAADEIRILIEKVQNINDNAELTLRGNYGKDNNEILSFKTSLHRELAYALDHCIHHQAIIKIAITHSGTDLKLDPDFGIAPSTIRHKNETQVNLHVSE